MAGAAVAVEPLPAAAGPFGAPWTVVLAGAAAALLVLLGLRALRRRLFPFAGRGARGRHPYASIVSADWPPVTVFVYAHNDEAVIDECLERLLRVDYPADRLSLVPVNDHSSDRTRERLDAIAARHPGRVRPLHRSGGQRGKAAALQEAAARATTPFAIVLDADCLPARGLVRRLMAPFFDPEVGAVIGRVLPPGPVPGVLARLFGAGRSGGWRLHRQARIDLRLATGYGDTVGGVRLAALDAVGGWQDDDDLLNDDDDLAQRLRLAGWQTVHHDCVDRYQEAPHADAVRKVAPAAGDRGRAQPSRAGRWLHGHAIAGFAALRASAAVASGGRGALRQAPVGMVA